MSLNEFSQYANCLLKLYEAQEIMYCKDTDRAIQSIYGGITCEFPILLYKLPFGGNGNEFAEYLKDKGIVETWHMILDLMREDLL